MSTVICWKLGQLQLETGDAGTFRETCSKNGHITTYVLCIPSPIAIKLPDFRLYTAITAPVSSWCTSTTSLCSLSAVGFISLALMYLSRSFGLAYVTELGWMNAVPKAKRKCTKPSSRTAITVPSPNGHVTRWACPGLDIFEEDLPGVSQPSEVCHFNVEIDGIWTRRSQKRLWGATYNSFTHSIAERQGNPGIDHFSIDHLPSAIVIFHLQSGRLGLVVQARIHEFPSRTYVHVAWNLNQTVNDGVIKLYWGF